jgi:hypothetical protein
MATKARVETPPIRRAPNTSLVEWIVAIASAVLVAGVVGFLVNDAIRFPETPPQIVVEVESIVTAGPGYIVLFRARNGGNSTTCLPVGWRKGVSISSRTPGACGSG